MEPAALRILIHGGEFAVARDVGAHLAGSGDGLPAADSPAQAAQVRQVPLRLGGDGRGEFLAGEAREHGASYVGIIRRRDFLGQRCQRSRSRAEVGDFGERLVRVAMVGFESRRHGRVLRRTLDHEVHVSIAFFEVRQPLQRFIGKHGGEALFPHVLLIILLGDGVSISLYSWP